MSDEEWLSMDEIVRSTIWVESCLFQHGKGDDNILFVGETLGCVREEILLIEANTNLIIIQHEDKRDRSNNLPHQHL